MLGLWLLKLAGFTLWSTLLMLLLRLVKRRYADVLQWPTLYWWLLLLASVPLWPQWQWSVAIEIPQIVWFDTTSPLGLLIDPLQQPTLQSWWSLELFWQGLFGILLLGAGWQFAQLAKQSLQLRTLYRHSQPVALTELFTAGDSLAPHPELDPRLHSMQIRRHDLALSPFIFGGRRAVLMLPAYYWQFNQQQRALLLAHELHHWQRRDPWQLLAWRLVVAAAWFNPALRYFERLFVEAMELTVDRHVLSAQPQQALLYGLTLVSSLKLCQPQAHQGLASFIQASGDEAGYRQRLAALFQTNREPRQFRFWLPLLVLSLALLLNVGCSTLQANAGPSGQWQLPVVQAKVNSGFGQISALRANRPHTGIDFRGKTGDPVMASEDGVVLIADNASLNHRLGNTVLIDHGQGYQTLYAHLDTFTVQAGSKIRAGQQIGTVGATGVATGPHLHFELLHQGKPQDPTTLLQWEPLQ
ncbi:MAG: peptidoglycan DD-metalloendopeptidase family protein [Rheinheimera sp.]